MIRLNRRYGMYKHVINVDKKMGHINPEIQGHFSEHLGRCIYEGYMSERILISLIKTV